ncbi:hypothetical protein [Alkalihalobacillus deserti]|uniref:hypothetical protein n=1 Tax=Alkalihalobacillus deserti TaxID=2879466 RepID=UPI001D139EBF|nr:hypothetical protein [Alkalihalobacillus deserti]
MASIYSAIKCPYCGRSAFEDDYYKSDEKYISCLRCGFNYSKTMKEGINNLFEYEEDRQEGHGVFSLVKKDGKREMRMLNYHLTNNDIDKYKKTFLEKDVDQEKSYLVTYEAETFI